jgi:GNAT superfamily N-acetyltransferase
MDVEISEEPLSALPEHARIATAFEVRAVLEVSAPAHGLGGLVLAERALDAPYRKDYDADSGGPAAWPRHFDLSSWGLLAARVAGRRVGGAVIAFDTPAVNLLEGRTDLAVLWDIRVAPEARGHGVGTALFAAAEGWARARGCRWLEAETQNINLPACRFYVRQGCLLRGIHRFAYPDLPDEVMLLWCKALARSPAGGG